MPVNETIRYTWIADVSQYNRGVDSAATSTSRLSTVQKETTTSTRAVGAASATTARSIATTGNAMAAATAKASRYGTAMSQAGAKALQTAQRFQRAGLAGLALTGVATQMGFQFEREMSKITGLVGIASDEVEEMKSSVIGLAGETAQAPQQLAESMFVLQSAGLRGAEAMEALEMSARLSAAGMGEARTIAQAMTSILDQYGDSGMTAARAADILAATARAGNFESSQLAGSLGKVTPIAAQLGVSMEDVGGAIALLTRANGNASRSTTQVAASMRVLLNPSEQATKILASAGLTMAEVRATASGEQGLVGALRQLFEATGENEEAFAKLLGSEEAVLAAFSILNASAETQAETFGAVADSAGVASEAFEAAADTSAFKFQQAMTELKASAIELGLTVGPAVADMASTVVSGITTIADALGPLSGPIGVATVALLGFAAVGPRVVAAARSIQQGLRMIVNMNPLVLATTVALGAVAAAFIDMRAASARTRERVKLFNDTVEEATGSQARMEEAAARVNGELRDQAEAVDEAAGAWSELDPNAAGFLALIEDSDVSDFAGQLRGLGVELEALMTMVGASDNATAEQLGVLDDALEQLAQQGVGLSADIVFELSAVGEAARKATEEANANALAFNNLMREQGLWTAEQQSAATGAAQLSGAIDYQVVAMNSLLDEWERASNAIPGVTAEMANQWSRAEPEVDELTASVEAAAPALDDLSASVAVQAVSWSDATDAIDGYQRMLDGLISVEVRHQDAIIESIESFETLNEAVVGVGADGLAGLSLFDEEFRTILSTANGTADAIQELVFTTAATEGPIAAAALRDSWVSSLRDILAEIGMVPSAIDQVVARADVADDVLIRVKAETESAQSSLQATADLAMVLGTSDPTVVANALTDAAMRNIVNLIGEVDGLPESVVVAIEGDPDTFMDALADVWEELTAVQQAEIVAIITAQSDQPSFDAVRAEVDAFNEMNPQPTVSPTMDPAALQSVWDEISAIQNAAHGISAYALPDISQEINMISRGAAPRLTPLSPTPVFERPVQQPVGGGSRGGGSAPGAQSTTQLTNAQRQANSFAERFGIDPGLVTVDGQRPMASTPASPTTFGGLPASLWDQGPDPWNLGGGGGGVPAYSPAPAVSRPRSVSATRSVPSRISEVQTLTVERVAELALPSETESGRGGTINIQTSPEPNDVNVGINVNLAGAGTTTLDEATIRDIIRRETDRAEQQLREVLT